MMILSFLLKVFIVSFPFFFVFQCFFLYKKSHGSPLFKKWPFRGRRMVPRWLIQIHRIYDLMVKGLEANNLNFAVKGPWFTGIDFLLTADPRNIHHILSSNFQNYPKGPGFKKIFDALGDGILAADSELWEDLRKSNHTLFHNKDFLELAVSSNIRKLKKDLFPFLDKAVEENITLDLQDVFQRYMFDIFSILINGYDPMTLSTETPEVEFPEAVDLGQEVVFYRHLKPVILWKLQRWFGIGLERKMKVTMAAVDKMLAKIISSRREEIISGERETSMDVLTYYINVDTTKYKLLKPKNDMFIRDVVFSLLAAGRDTTSAALTRFFWLLSMHPQVMAKIRDEINTKYDPADLEKLVYLHAVLSETLRLYPPVPFNHKSPAKSDVLPSGHKVEANSKIIISVYALGRMRSVWGEDASDFKPERWISDKGRLRQEPSYKFLAFNSGPRTCLGKNLALSQMKIVAVNIIRNYEFKIVEGQKIEQGASMILSMKHGLKVTVSKNT
ncbi:PREDICTED: alkane hydroxylase MAH1-like [Camelina sativa]|uniref:Alkane hydroxylase MAH1-like n=1 Tax=Camelina sativa TaxID=90675 RepID=A0ABM0Z5R5_CAMSA|nr:PREDICTED: alkane hydroxylase MAH1-like [Camelina sativa]